LEVPRLEGEKSMIIQINCKLKDVNLRLIAIMLGRLRMTIPECIEIFKHISKSVFGENPGTFRRLAKQIAGRPFFNAQALEKAIKELLTARGIDSDTLFKESNDPKCKVWVYSCSLLPLLLIGLVALMIGIVD